MRALQYFVIIVFSGFTLLVLDSNNHQRHDIGSVVSVICHFDYVRSVHVLANC